MNRVLNRSSKYGRPADGGAGSKLTRAKMEEIIRGGSSVVVNNHVYSRADDLPIGPIGQSETTLEPKVMGESQDSNPLLDFLTGKKLEASGENQSEITPTRETRDYEREIMQLEERLAKLERENAELRASDNGERQLKNELRRKLRWAAARKDVW